MKDGRKGDRKDSGKDSRKGIKEGKASGKGKYRVLQIMCGMVFAGCMGWLAVRAALLGHAKMQIDDLREAYIVEEADTPESAMETPGSEPGSESVPTSTPEPDPLEEYDVPKKQIDFAGLKKENPHIYAWISIPGTDIDSPVLQHPEELDYYLTHNVDGSKGKPGSIYSQLMNSRDWTDKHTILYGHNEQKGTVFGDLHLYEDPEFFAEHSFIYIYTEEKILVYQIFAAHEHSNGHLLMTEDISTDEAYEAYLQGIFEPEGINDNYDEEMREKLDADSRILTLSTCITNRWTRRWLVQAVLVAEGDAPYAAQVTKSPDYR